MPGPPDTKTTTIEVYRDRTEVQQHKRYVIQIYKSHATPQVRRNKVKGDREMIIPELNLGVNSKSGGI